MDRTADGQAREVEYVLIHTTYDDGVHLDRREAVFERGVDTGECLFDAAEARDLRKPCGVRRVERDVDAIQTCCVQVGRHTRQQGAVGGEEMSSIPEIERISSMSGTMRWETSGSPPVRRTRVMPSCAMRCVRSGLHLLGGEQLAVGARARPSRACSTHAAEVAFITSRRCAGELMPRPKPSCSSRAMRAFRVVVWGVSLA